MAGAVPAAMARTAALPDAERVGPRWMLPLIEGLLLVAVVVGDPGRIDRRSRTLRALSILLVSVLVFGALWSTAQPDRRPDSGPALPSIAAGPSPQARVDPDKREQDDDADHGSDDASEIEHVAVADA